MAIKDINTLKGKFADDKEPNGADFGDFMDSYYHRSSRISQNNVLGLTDALDDKATKEDLANATTNFKGYHTTLAALLSAYPQAKNKKDFFAWVGSPYPGTVYKVFADSGAWTDTGEVPTQQEIDLAEYIKKDELTIEITDEKGTIPSNYAVNSLKENLYGAGSFLDEAIPYQDKEVNRVSFLGFGSFAYSIQNNIQGKYIESIKVNIETAGTFTVFFATNPKTAAFSETWSQTFNVVVGENTLSINKALAADEWLFFCKVTDTSQFRWDVNSTVQGGFITHKADNTWTESGGGNLSMGVYLKGMPTEAIPYKSESNKVSLLGYRGFSYANQDVIQGKYIDSVKVNIETAGTFTVYFAINRQTAAFAETWSQTFNVIAGENTLAINRILKADEWLFFCKVTDTSQFRWDINTTIQNGFILLTGAGAWQTNAAGNLCIGVFILVGSSETGDIPKLYKMIEDIGGDGKLKDKKLSIMGDSISTFNGYIPPGNATFYPNGTVTNVNQTWWQMLVNETGMQLVINQSWSGSRLSSGRGTASMFCSPTRYESLGNPDVILIFGGTNDYNQRNPDCQIGEYSWITDGARDLSVFRQSYQFLVEKLLSLYSASKIFLLVPLVRKTGSDSGLFEPNAVGWSQQDLRDVVLTIAEKYGVESIDLSKCGITYYNTNKYLQDGLHPNADGMKLIKDYILGELNKRY